MGKTKMLFLVGLTIAMLDGAVAFAGHNHAALCNPRPEDVNDVGYDPQYGVYNRGSTSALVHCGGGKGFNFFSNMVATAYDRSGPKNVCCLMQLTDARGRLFGSSRPCTSGVRAGTSDDSFQLVGGLPTGEGYVNMWCELPPADPVNGYSYVTTYDIP